jgi:uncharacterized protein YbjT (DUF2867 family)
MNSRDNHRVLVLGATGKTGSRVAERLSAHGHRPRRVDRRHGQHRDPG